jgi:hypothetical protein
MSRWPLPHRLNLALLTLLLLTVWGLFWHASIDGGHGYGGDFRQFYAAGWIVDFGDVGRLYDQAYFREVQLSEWGDPHGFYSLYPPILALVLAPFARLPLASALNLWWGLQAVCFLAAGGMLWRSLPIVPAWRQTALFALACSFPLWMAVRIGHLTPLLLLILVSGLTLHSRGRRMLAGVVLSALALKPQFAAAICLWLLLRRDVKAGCGMLLGSLAQGIVLAACLGPSVIIDYFVSFPVIAQKAKSVLFSPVFDQSFAGILGWRMWHLGYDPRNYGNAFLLTQLAAGGLAGFLLLRIVQANRRLQRLAVEPSYGPRYEYAAVVLLLLLLTPYLLVYDLALLAIPIVCLWSSPGWRMGVALYLSITLVFAFVYLWLGFSLVPFLELIVLARMAAALRSLALAAEATPQDASFTTIAVHPA